MHVLKELDPGGWDHNDRGTPYRNVYTCFRGGAWLGREDGRGYMGAQKYFFQHYASRVGANSNRQLRSVAIEQRESRRFVSN